MTVTDKPAFVALLSTLAAGRGKVLTTAQMDGLWTLLDDLSLPALRLGALASAREDRYFPQAQLIRDRIADVQRAEARALALERAPIDDGTCACDVCADTGWQAVMRDGGACVAMTDLVGVAQDAYRVRPCACRPWNRVYHAKRAGEQRQGRAGEREAS